MLQTDSIKMNQIELHKKIESILRAEPKNAKLDEIKTLIRTNPDARQFIFTQADERRLEWLWDNG